MGLIERLADRYAVERFDINRPGMDIPLMIRWVLCGRRGGEGSKGSSKYAVYLHKFFRSDPDEMHDHPWGFVSVILSGGYWEVTPGRGWKDGVGPVQKRWHGPGRILMRPANWIHRVVLPEGKAATTLLFRGQRERSWGFWCKSGYVPWRDHAKNIDRTGVGCPG